MYVIFGGADYGAGIVELFSKKDFKEKTQTIMYRSIGPIWEANHMWLVITVVILFVGFPRIYADVSNYLHIPLVIMLLGIIARGTSFTFRNYDAIQDRWHNLYAIIFTYSSFITPLFLGIIAASSVSGSIDPNATNFLDAYIFSWLTWFNFSVGIFTVIICGFLASIYSLQTIGKRYDLLRLKRLAYRFSVATFIVGGLVFSVSFWQKIPLTDWIFEDITGYISVLTATIFMIFLIWAIKTNRFILARIYSAAIIVCILVAVSYSHFPDIILFKDQSTLSLLTHRGSEKTIEALAWALMIGSIFILPFLFYLIYSFNKQNEKVID